ncbi:DUF4232 domain-containing protein [Streptomyces sp. NPDC088258]|uniref:DUF4232 domain-containing protein n=1 Tax=Streptomyces sp. NPDC088258 TaxID=3365849 RepID=UPI0038276F09
MSSIRNSRTRLLTGAATAALAALSLTACSDGTGVADEGASTKSSTAVSSSANGTDSTESASGASDRGTSAKDASDPGTSAQGTSERGSASGDAKQAGVTSKAVSSAGKVVTCEGSNTKTVAAPLNRPINHMLLTVTNTGKNTCYLYSYPAVRFGEAQAVPPVIEDSQPQAVVTLEPGESGYASVNLSSADGSGAHGRTEKSLAVYFHGRSGNESVGTGAFPSLPAGGVYIDDSLKVTYWQQRMEDAIIW